MVLLRDCGLLRCYRRRGRPIIAHRIRRSLDEQIVHQKLVVEPHRQELTICMLSNHRSVKLFW